MRRWADRPLSRRSDRPEVPARSLSEKLTAMSPVRRGSGGLAVLVIVGSLALAACSTGTEPSAGPVETQPGPTTAAPPTTVASTTTTTLVPPPTTTTPPLPPPTTAPPLPPVDVAVLQARLVELGYFVSDAPGEAGPGTRNAVMAFQKLNGLERDGVVGPQTTAALAVAAPVAPQGGVGPHIEVDLAAQVAIVVAADGTVTTLNATTGKVSTPTPAGTFRVFRQVNGWDPGPYGSLYRPKYFTGGIALHGGVPVLARPASHGCVRLPDPAVDWLWSSGLAASGTRVIVY